MNFLLWNHGMNTKKIFAVKEATDAVESLT